MYFKHKNDEGVYYTQFSDHGIPLVTLALVATVVSLAIVHRFLSLRYILRWNVVWMSG
jgi:hypothetical protein